MAPGSIVESVETLPARFLEERARGLGARFRLRIGSLVRDVVVGKSGAEVVQPAGDADSTISTSPSTWLELDSGRLSGIEAFAQRRLGVRGSIQKAIMFEPLFERPDAGGLRYEVRSVPVGRKKISTVVAGDPGAQPLLMLHGLGATKASMLPILPDVARHFRVYAMDLPGFGLSSKPRGRYDATWFAAHMLDYMDELGIDTACLVGNSMGGRIAQEIAMVAPERVQGITCLCPATAFARRPALGLVKVLRPELGIAVAALPRKRVQDGMKMLFKKPSCIDDSWYEAATDDLLKTWRSPRARMSFFAAMRNIYLEEPYGQTGFFTRLAKMEIPALYIYGRHDPLITPRYGRKISDILPAATVEVWDDCGHVPQLEHPDRTVDRILGFFLGEGVSLAG